MEYGVTENDQSADAIREGLGFAIFSKRAGFDCNLGEVEPAQGCRTTGKGHMITPVLGLLLCNLPEDSCHDRAPQQPS
jgi:hypothetical protein